MTGRLALLLLSATATVAAAQRTMAVGVTRRPEPCAAYETWRCVLGDTVAGRPASTRGPTTDDMVARLVVGSAHVRASAWSIAASAALPGAGQAMLNVDRFIPYAAFETYSWTQYAAHAAESRHHRDEYRALAARVARSAFTVVFPAGNWDYYERMEHFIDSGVFEVVAGGMLDPEPDTTTYNGSVWLLARRTYWRDISAPPDTSTREWKLAVDFYLRRAYDQPFRWSWRNAQLEYDQYRLLVGRSNDSNRKALQDLGAILANHVLSTVDAYVTVRVRRRLNPAHAGWEVGAEVPWSTLRRR